MDKITGTLVEVDGIFSEIVEALTHLPYPDYIITVRRIADNLKKLSDDLYHEAAMAEREYFRGRL